MIECSLRDLKYILDSEEEWERFQEEFGPCNYEERPSTPVKISLGSLMRIQGNKTPYEKTQESKT